MPADPPFSFVERAPSLAFAASNLISLTNSCRRRRARERPCANCDGECPPWDSSTGADGGAAEAAEARRASESSALIRPRDAAVASALAGAPQSMTSAPSRSSKMSSPGRDPGRSPAATAAAAAAASGLTECPWWVPAAAVASLAVRSSPSVSSLRPEPGVPNSEIICSLRAGSDTSDASSQPTSAARGTVIVSRSPVCVNAEEGGYDSYCLS